MKYYTVIMQNEETGERKEFICESQHPNKAGWKIVGVSGFFEKHKKNKLKEN